MQRAGGSERAAPSREVRRLRCISLVLLAAAIAQPAVAQSAPVVAVPLTAFDSAKVRALLRERLPCLGCHTLEGTGGISGPDLTHVASRRTPALIEAVIENPQRVVPGTVMPRIAMPPRIRALVTRYLTGGAASGALSATPAVPGIGAAPASGAALYARYCASCHGARGDGDGPNARHLPVRPAVHADAALMSTKSDDRLFDAIAVGGYPMGRSPMMPAFGQTLSRDEIWRLVRHLRTLCNCAGPSWSRPSARAASP